jgi:aerobic-type carbon monoxide dehydrogenase small subunit (CoxS/CutS family)
MRLSVNGRAHRFLGEPATPLLWVLRDELGLRGAKFGCGQGICGACTVHRDGQPIRSCVTPVGTLEDAHITTIEGLSRTGDHPVQHAWIAEDVPQCGYCQAGQIMSASALLSRVPDPTDTDIDQAMNGNLCRCGTYARIRRAIRRAAGDEAR